MNSLQSIFTLFDTAIASRLKYPEIHLQTADGQPVEIKRAGSKSRYPGQLMLTDGRPYGQNVYFGRIALDGSFVPGHVSKPDLLPLLERLASNPAEVAGEYGRLTGRCSFCGLQLTDPESTAVGYGPICASHYGLPHAHSTRRQIPQLAEVAQ